MFNKIKSNKFFITIFFFFLILIFLVFWKLLFSYFEADDWFHFTAYLPLTREPQGAVVALIKSITDAHSLSGGQHFVPIGGSIYFLNTLLFGINFFPYAFMSLLLHSINSFLVFFLIKQLLTSKSEDPLHDAKIHKKSQVKKDKKERKYLGLSLIDIMALLGGVFFALSVVSIPNVTWAAFYGQNVFSVTLFLLCIILFKQALVTKKKVFLYTSVVLLFIAILTKETASSLFIILPVIALLEKRTFPFKLLTKLYVLVLVIFILFRFVVPQAVLGMNNLSDIFTKGINTTNTVDTSSTDLSIHKDIKAVLFFRVITFPLKTVSQVYFPRSTVQEMVLAIAPVIYPLPSDNEELLRSQNRQFFANGPGNDFMVYLLSFVILICAAFILRMHYRKNEWQNINAFILGFTIIIASTLPLVMIILSFPRWGYDTYFDQRHYYMPSIGGAILFPLLLFGIAKYVSYFIKSLTKISLPWGSIVALLFIVWFLNNMLVTQAHIEKSVTIESLPRKDIIYQLKQQLPRLPDNAVISVQTDEYNGYGSQLPFQTSFAQILSIIYYDTNPLPDSFFEKPILDNKPEGYQSAEGRSLGYYTTKKSLADNVLLKKFSIDDIYAFSFIWKENKLTQTTEEVREEMKKYLKESEVLKDWEIYEASTSAESLTMKRPPELEILEVPFATTEAKQLKKYDLIHSDFDATMQLIRTVPMFDPIESFAISDSLEGSTTLPYKATYDRYHFQDVLKSTSADQTTYIFKVDDLLVSINVYTSDPARLETIEKVIGSMVVIEK